MLLVFFGCGGGGGYEPPPKPIPANRFPAADAGSSVSQSISPANITLNGSGSFDPDGDTISYSWTILQQPAEASVSLSDTSIATPTFSSMVPGDYEFQLVISDTAGHTSTATVTVSLVNDAPVVSIAGINESPLAGTQIILDASATVDPNEHPITFSWQVVELPANSGLPTSYNGPTHSLLFDVHGDFVLELQVDDGYEIVTVQIVIEVTAYEVVVLNSTFTDAEYNDSNKRIVTVAGNSLHIIELNGTESTVALPSIATAVSIAPDGLTAAVAHNGEVTHVDLEAGLVLATHAVPADLGDIVLDGQNIAHGVASTGQFTEIQSVDLSTGVVQSGTGLIYGDTLAKLHPDGDRMYGANQISPGDLERYSINSGAANVDYDSPSRDYDFCGDIWLAPTGRVALSRCRYIVWTTNDPDTDLTYAMQLDGPYGDIGHASMNEFDDEWLIAYEGTYLPSDIVYSYGIESGAPVEKFGLPFIDDTYTDRWNARFVFGASDSGKHFVLAVDDPANPGSYALLSKQDPAASTHNFAPSAIAPRYASARVAENVILDASASIDPEGQPVSFEWTLASEPAGSNIVLSGQNSDTLQFTPTVAGSYEVELIVSDGDRSSPTARSSVSVFEADQSMVLRLEGVVVDAEYSKVLNLFAYLTYPDRTLHLLDLTDFTETEIELVRSGWNIGIAPDGLHAAVSHAGLASLVDLSAGVIVDTQEIGAEWGDIVLDHNNRAHVIPYRGQWVEFYSMDFAANTWASLNFVVFQNGQLRMHPTADWVYVADRGLHPDDVEKYDVSTLPATKVGASPYHGEYNVSGNVWISEDGDKLFAARGNTFNATSDPGTDMTFAGVVPDNMIAYSADHSAAIDQWLVVTRPGTSTDPAFEYKMIFYSDSTLDQLEVRDLEPIQSDSVSVPTAGLYASFSDDGSRVIVLIGGDGLHDAYAIQLSDR